MYAVAIPRDAAITELTEFAADSLGVRPHSEELRSL